MPAREGIALLRRIADGRDTPADRDALAGRVRTYLNAAPRGGSLDAAFGLARANGAPPWWRAEALEARDVALRSLASRFYPGSSGREQARAIRRALVAYAGGGWRMDCSATSPPVRYLGTEREALFDVMKARGAAPSVALIRRALGDC